VSRLNNDAIIVALVGDDGKLTSVRRYTARQSDLAERFVLAAVHAGRQVRLTFLNLANGVDTLSDAQREAIERAAR